MQKIIDRMRKIQIETKMTWVELPPQALDRIHDSFGEGELSPYQIDFGMERPLGRDSLPNPPRVWGIHIVFPTDEKDGWGDCLPIKWCQCQANGESKYGEKEGHIT